MKGPILEFMRAEALPSRRVEYVERKGRGHPDSICDALMESLSLALCKYYLEQTGRVYHYNLDKSLLVAGETTPRLGGGRIDKPIRLIFGDRATFHTGEIAIPVEDILDRAVREWFPQNLRFVDPQRHLVLQNELHPGSPELIHIFSLEKPVANDTSLGVGFAPLTETERLVLAAERSLNSEEFKNEFPETGEDVKVMGVRQGDDLTLTLAVAFVDRFLDREAAYYDRKEEVRRALMDRLRPSLQEIQTLDVQINTLDRPGEGLDGMYLTVLGTSAEGGDSGQVGRGNRVNGLISYNRPLSMEAAAGKNAVSHVGKVYNLLSHQIAHRIYSQVEGIEEVTVWLCSQIGKPLQEPSFSSIRAILKPGADSHALREPIAAVVHDELAHIQGFIEKLIKGQIPIC